MLPLTRSRNRSRFFPPFSPASLFSAGEQGAWYDPSDFSTLFTDSAGTTPVTAVEQFVGLMLDKSKGLVGSTKYGEVFGASGAAGNYFSSPDSSAASITGDIDIRIKASLNDWTPGLERYLVSKWAATGGGNTSYIVGLTPSGALTLIWSTTGSNTISRTSTATLGLSDGATKWVRCTLDVNNGAGGHDVKFFTSNDGTAWVQLGSTITTAGTTSIFDSTAAVNVAGFNSGNVNSIESGKYYRVQILNGIDGTVAVDFDPTRYISGSTFTSATGEVWTLNGLTRIVPDGNHAFQTTSAKRPKLAARYNLLTRTEEFNDAVWDKLNGVTIASSAVTPPISGASVSKLIAPNSTGTLRVLRQVLTTGVNGASYTASAYLQFVPGEFQWVRMLATDAGSVWFDIQNGVIGTQTGATGTLTNVGNGWYRCTITATASSTNIYSYVLLADADNSTTATGNGVKGVLISAADLRPASQATGLIGPTYQRVVDAATYDAVGFLPYLQFDGLSWSMGTNSINPGAVDKAQVFAGVRKLSDAAQGAVAEFSATIASNNGTFLLAAPDGATQTYGFDSKGTTQVDAVASSLAAPRTNVVTGLADIAGDSCVIRVDGAVADTETGDQGTGNFLTYPLFIGGRNNASLFFNGWLSSLIVRFGANLSQSQIEATEAWVNGKTGAY